MKRKFNKRIVLIFIIIIVLIILLLSLVFIKNKLKKANVIQLSGDRHYIERFVQSNSVYDIYKGDISAHKISNKVQFIFTVMLPEMYEKVNNKTNEEIIDYFQEEQERINLVLGIENPQEFVEFIQKALTVDCDFANYEGVTYTTGSYKKDGNEETLKFVVKYQNGKKLNCILHINALSTEKLEARIEIE